MPPAFFGAADSRITRALCNSIRIAYVNGLPADAICELFELEPELIESDLSEIEAEVQPSIELPLSSDIIWKNILTETVPLATGMLPLRLLLSRLKREVIRSPGRLILEESVSELRSFFIRHSAQLKSEYQQINACATYQKKSNRHCLKVPGPDNPIWHQLLCEKTKLVTESMPLRFFLAQQVRGYRSSIKPAQRDDAVLRLQQFIQLNADRLTREIETLTEWARKTADKAPSLPDIDNRIWQDILLSDDLLTSEKVNYRLLISRLKNNYRQTGDKRNLELLRDFFSQNSHAMEEEIHKIISLVVSQ